MNDFLYIMDYSDCGIYKIDLSNEEDNDTDRILTSYGINIDECVYMYSQQDINIIQTLEKIKDDTSV